MRPADNINKLIKKLHISASNELDQRVHSDISQALEQSKDTKSVIKKPNVWRIIMKSQITKLTAAAVIIMIAVLVATFLDKSVTPAYAIEDTIEAMREVETVHMIGKDWNGHIFDSWMRINPATGLQDHFYMEGWVTCNGETYERIIVSTPDLSYSYNKSKNVVTVYDGQLIRTSFKFGSIFEQILENLDNEKKVEIYQGEINDSGKDVIVIIVHGEKKTWKILVDPKTKLPISFENFGPDTTDLKKTEQIHYNQPLPKGIFELEMPEGATVIQKQKD
jgi:hypothetical protein